MELEMIVCLPGLDLAGSKKSYTTTKKGCC